MIRTIERLLAWAIILPLCSAANAQLLENRTISETPQQSQRSKPAVPRLVRFSSALIDGAGRTIAGTVPVIFSIYAQQQDEKPLWTETQIVSADESGSFSVLLGAATTSGLPLDQFQTNQAQWLGFHAEGQLEQRRVLLVSTPYALKAAEAEFLDGLPVSAFVQWKDLADALAQSQPSTLHQMKPTAATPATSSVAGDLKFSSTGSGIVFSDGSKQTTAGKVQVQVGAVPNTVVERDNTGSISVKDANLQGNLKVPVTGFIATPDAMDANVGIIPKLFLSASGGPIGGGVIPSLTFRSLNPNHIFGEVAFQDNTPSPGQDIWALQQDFTLNHTEDFALRRRGQQVMTFWPLSSAGSDVLTTLSGTRFRFERSGPYPVEFRDDSFALPEGLWRMFISQNCWFLDKNTALAGNFASHNPVLETCADGNLLLGAGLRTSGPLTSLGDFVINSGGNISFTSSTGRNIFFNPGTGGANLFSAPIGVGVQMPLANLHVTSGGNLQEAIFESLFNANEGISIRNPVQNWALGMRADLGEEFEIRNITSGIDALEIAPSGVITVGHGNLNAASGIRVDSSVNGDGSGLKHGRAAIVALAKGASASVELDWRTPFADANYTINCDVVTGATSAAALRLHHIQSVLTNKVVAVVVNDDPVNSESGVLHCIAMHD